jgi:YD repeat-containing protein
MKITYTTIVLLSFLFLTGCSKDEASPSICYLSSYSGSYAGSYTYTNNKLTASTEYGTSATYVYDSKGNIITINYSDGSVENYTYDANNKKLTVTNPFSYQLKYTYNISGQLTKRELYNYNSLTTGFDFSEYLTFEYQSGAS